MLGMNLRTPDSTISGIVDAQTVTPDGKAIVRIADRWVDADVLVAA